MAQTGLKKNLLLSTFYQVLTMVLPLITAPYAARVLGVDGTGIYSYTQSYSVYFALFAALGTASYGTREIARSRDSAEARSRLFWEIALLSVATSLLSLCGWGILILGSGAYRRYYVILTLTILAAMFDISWFYAGMEAFQYTVAQNSLFKLLGAASIFAFVKTADDLWKYVLITSLTVFLANASMWVFLPKFIRRTPVKSLRPWRHLRETLVYFIPTIATSVYTILDKTLIGLITRSTSENGNYEQATKVVNMAKSICFAGVNLVLQSRASFLFAKREFEEIKRLISASMDYILFAGCAICFGLMGVSKRFVPFFFGSGYEGTIPLLRWMGPLVVIVGVSNCLGAQYYNPAGLRARSARYIIAGSAINLVMNLLLIPRFGSFGAVIATLIAEGTISALYLRNCDGYYGLSGLLSQLWKKLVAGVVMAAAVHFVGERVGPPLAAIAVQVLAGAGVYCALLLLMGDSFCRDTLIPRIARFGKGR